VEGSPEMPPMEEGEKQNSGISLGAQDQRHTHTGPLLDSGQLAELAQRRAKVK
jgi:hypothetical protein